MLLAAAALFGVLTLLYFVRSRRWISKRGLQLTSTAAALILLVLMVASPPPLAAPAESGEGYPYYVEKELRDYLLCGDLSRG